jgi:hypothetical protein
MPLVTGAALLLAPAAGARIRAAVSVHTSGGTRVVVRLTSSKPLRAKQLPVSVSVHAPGRTFRLTRAGGAGAASVSLGTWQSNALTGAAAAGALALQGKTVTVRIRSRHGSMALQAAVAPGGAGGTTPGGATPGGTTPGGTTPGATTPGGTSPGGTTPGATAPGGTTPGGTSPGGTAPGGTPLFNPPGHELTGQAAYDNFKQYFLNSEFSDCQAGHWPSCSVENRYEHGSDGTFEYRRCTPTSDADINFVDSYTVTGANQHADGSWVIEYTDQNGVGFYHREVATNGTVNGYYIYNGGSPESLTGYFWRQPADLGDCYSG